MTIVCAITDGKRTWIGSDRQVTTSNGEAVRLREGKWTQTPSGWWVGVSGWGRMVNLVECCVEASYDAHGLAARIRGMLAADGWAPMCVDEGPRQYNSRMLMARTGELWMADSSGHVLRHPDHDLAAIGDAEPIAVGAARGFVRGVGLARERHGVHPRTFGQVKPIDIVEAAVEASIEHSAGCGMGIWLRELWRAT